MLVGTARIVGVVRHVKHWGLDADDTATIRDQIYYPFDQVPEKFANSATTGLTLIARTAPDPMSMLAAVRAEVAGPGRDQPIYAVRTLDETLANSLAERRFTMLMLIVFAATALLLAAVGIYAVMSYAVNRRAHELGIRVALGATRRGIAELVLRQGMRLAGIGTICGIAAALALTRLMSGLLYGVRPADPLTLIGVAALLTAIALLACYVPARRAVAVDPIVALRSE